MVKHIVFWNLKETAEGKTKEENAAIIKAGLEDLVGKIDGLEKAQVSRGINPKGFDLCLYSEFSSREALAFYQDHPLHDQVRQYVHKVIDRREVFDSEE
ncbi:MAG TPA: Dabb family protein [Firmicutes bacterium]|nr:Dabb family protein [Bacillota bacterium]